MLSNLPPGVTDRMIDEQCSGYNDDPYCPDCGEDLVEDDDGELYCPNCKDAEDAEDLEERERLQTEEEE